MLLNELNSFSLLESSLQDRPTTIADIEATLRRTAISTSLRNISQKKSERLKILIEVLMDKEEMDIAAKNKITKLPISPVSQTIMLTLKAMLLHII